VQRTTIARRLSGHVVVLAIGLSLGFQLGVLYTDYERSRLDSYAKRRLNKLTNFVISVKRSVTRIIKQLGHD